MADLRRLVRLRVGIKETSKGYWGILELEQQDAATLDLEGRGRGRPVVTGGGESRPRRHWCPGPSLFLPGVTLTRSRGCWSPGGGILKGQSWGARSSAEEGRAQIPGQVQTDSAQREREHSQSPVCPVNTYFLCVCYVPYVHLPRRMSTFPTATFPTPGRLPACHGGCSGSIVRGEKK